MKPIKKKRQKEIDTIDNEKEHNQILFELGILDDLEDWSLFQKQEEIFKANTNNMENEEYFRLMGKEYIPRPIPKMPISRPKIKINPESFMEAFNKSNIKKNS
jgi:hypothetical protein